MREITVKAFAKINLTLDVLGQRTDGFHEVAMVMQGIDLHDMVTLKKVPGRKIILSCDNPELPKNRDNLAYRAAELLCEELLPSAGLSIDIKKRIPLAAGLAGGSADAAAVILGMNALFDLRMDWEKMRILAARLGSDVPFCLNPLTALATGRGEVLQSLPVCPQLWLVLVKPPFGVATKDVYKHLHYVRVEKRPSLRQALQALAAQDTRSLLTAAANVLEYSTFALQPQLAGWAQELAESGAVKVMMSGSGPTLLGFCESAEEAENIAASWKKEGWFVRVTRTIHPQDIGERMIVNG